MDSIITTDKEADVCQGLGCKLEDLGFKILGNLSPQSAEVLTVEAMTFFARLERKFSHRRMQLLKERTRVQTRINEGIFPAFLPHTAHIRNSDWKIAPLPADLQDRRVEITGPSADTKMVINAFNSGANVYMSDFEDSLSPTWKNVIQGQMNLRDSIRKTIFHVSAEGKTYTLASKTATLMVRPRGWHLDECHVLLDGKPVSASLFDFALFLFHNAGTLLDNNTGPYFYLPKMENHQEARLWNDVFLFSQGELNIPRGTIKATVLIETILAAFEMNEILYELREHSAGLNCGRWDYIFSFIKKFHRHPRFVLPDRSVVTMEKSFLAAYVKLLIKTCHKRNAHAMGGMAAQIPIKDNPEENSNALAKVRADKEREVAAGHDGTWVAHPGLVHIAKEIFDRRMPGPNQIFISRDDVEIVSEELLEPFKGTVTERGIRTNINVGIQYIEAWLRGNGAVPLHHLMEDAATAEISRAQVWQWIHHQVRLDNGQIITAEFIHNLIEEELENIKNAVGGEKYIQGKYHVARHLFEQLVTQQEFTEFLTLPAYEYL